MSPITILLPCKLVVYAHADPFNGSTCVVSIVWYFLIADFPEDAKWLTDSERAWVKARMEVDQGRSAIERPTTMRDVGNFFKDYKVLLGALIYFGMIVDVVLVLLSTVLRLTFE